MSSLRAKILMVAAASLVAAIATFTTVMLLAMHDSSRRDEADELQRNVAAFRESLGVRQRASEGILKTIAWRPDVRQALADQDRDKLQELLEPTFEELRATFDIVQLYVHQRDGAVLLRVHAPGERGDSYVGNRPMVVDAARRRTTISAIDLDGGRLSRRTVTAVMEGERFLGLLELGLDYDDKLLREMKSLQGIDSRIWLSYEAAGPSGLWPATDVSPGPLSEVFLYASTYGNRRLLPEKEYHAVLHGAVSEVVFTRERNDPYSTLAVPLHGYHSRVLGILEISRSRAQAIASFRNSLWYTLLLATIVALAGIAILAATLNVVILRPLKALTHAARRQYDGDLSARAEATSSDELGLLAETFNRLSNRLTQTLKQQEQTIEDLEVARKAEEAANAAKDQFLAALSHELRTPLTPVLLAAESLEHSTRTPPELREDVHVIRRNVELEARLIDDLLDLTRITQDKLELHLQVCEVHSLLTAAISVCRAEAQAKDLTIETDFAAQSQWVNADLARLQQVFWNLVKNAVKFSPAHGRIRVSTANEVVEGQEHLVVRVVDSGIGMTEDVQGRLFKVFEQESRWTTRTFGGLGLGLAISKKIVLRHGGRIAGTSEGRGKGSVFTVWLPTVAEPAPAPVQQNNRPPAAPPLRILLVEDHAATAKAVKRLLEGIGHTVTPASSVASAMEAAAAAEFDLVISDLGLPDGEGTDLMRQLRDRYKLAGIAVSGYGMQDDINRSREAGFLAHLTKPITVEQLRHAIAEVWAELKNSAARPL